MSGMMYLPRLYANHTENAPPGSDFDANDVVMSWYVQWDAASPLHVGRDGSFTYFPGLWGGFMNAPAE